MHALTWPAVSSSPLDGPLCPVSFQFPVLLPVSPVRAVHRLPPPAGLLCIMAPPSSASLLVPVWCFSGRPVDLHALGCFPCCFLMCCVICLFILNICLLMSSIDWALLVCQVNEGTHVDSLSQLCGSRLLFCTLQRRLRERV